MDNEPEQGSMFDLEGKKLNPYWVDPKQKLFIPRQPLHWKAHRLQILLDMLDKQASKNPAQFNSRNYIDTLNEYTRVVTLINDGYLVDPEEQKKNAADDQSGLVKDREPGGSQAVGETTPPSVDLGVSADNPFAGQGVHSVRALPVPARVPELSGSVPGDK